MGTKIYVGRLPSSATDSQLKDLFAPHGTVQSATVIMDKFTGQSRLFGFVEMSTAEEAKQAIAALNGAQLGGRTLTVNEAKPKEERSHGGPGGNRGLAVDVSKGILGTDRTTPTSTAGTSAAGALQVILQLA